MARKPRRFSPEFGGQVVLELVRGERSAVEICRAHQLKDSLLYRWKQEFLERASQVFGARDQSELARQQQRIAELERMVGCLTMELEAAKKVSAWLGSR